VGKALNGSRQFDSRQGLPGFQQQPPAEQRTINHDLPETPRIGRRKEEAGRYERTNGRPESPAVLSNARKGARQRKSHKNKATRSSESHFLHQGLSSTDDEGERLIGVRRPRSKKYSASAKKSDPNTRGGVMVRMRGGKEFWWAAPFVWGAQLTRSGAVRAGTIACGTLRRSGSWGRQSKGPGKKIALEEKEVTGKMQRKRRQKGAGRAAQKKGMLAGF